jgi:general secretion pathway protein K
VVSRRAAVYFENSQEYINALPERLHAMAVSSEYAVESQYFLSETYARFGRAQVRLQALIYRQRNKMPEIIWVRRE